MFILQVLGAVLILSFLVFIHELGHFLMAKRNGVKVHEFALGFPPTFWKKKYGETEYKLNLIPFGGYVKLHGEDSWDPKIVKDKKSFASKTPWQKTEILLGGVLMNFLVFWVLSTISLSVGTEPLIASVDDFRDQFVDQRVDFNPGFVNLDDSVVDFYELYEAGDAEKLQEYVLEEKIKKYIELPALKVNQVDNNSVWNDVLKEGDVLVSLNKVPLFDVNFLKDQLSSGVDVVSYSLIRDGEVVEGFVDYTFGLEVGQVVTDSLSDKAGVEVGDILKKVDGVNVSTNVAVPRMVTEIEGPVEYVFERDGKMVVFEIDPEEDGVIGIYLKPRFDGGAFGVDYTEVIFPSTINLIEKVKYPVWKAPFVALKNGWVVSKLTAKAFVGTLTDVFLKLKVSEDIGGPVQVAKMSFDFVGVGGTKLMNFVALISLSLAVVNVLPIPALDGGRLLFVIVEAFRGKPLDRKLESVLHAIGFFMLMALILVVTIFDLLRL